LLELWEACQKNIPVIVLQVEGKGYNASEARELINALETRLPPGALDEVQEHLNCGVVSLETGIRRLASFKSAIVELVDNNGPPLVYNPLGTDNQILAHTTDLLERMADVTGRQLSWTDPLMRKPPALERSMSMWQRYAIWRQASQDPAQQPKLLILADLSSAASEARLLQASALGARLNMECVLASPE